MDSGAVLNNEGVTKPMNATATLDLSKTSSVEVKPNFAYKRVLSWGQDGDAEISGLGPSSRQHGAGGHPAGRHITPRVRHPMIFRELIKTCSAVAVASITVHKLRCRLYIKL